jgi:hypothetical protein
MHSADQLMTSKVRMRRKGEGRRTNLLSYAPHSYLKQRIVFFLFKKYEEIISNNPLEIGY